MSGAEAYGEFVSLPIQTYRDLESGLRDNLGALDSLEWWGIKGIMRLVLKVSRQLV